MSRSIWGMGPLLAAVLLWPSGASAVYVYPANGQSEEQLSRDKYECHRWAANATGYDPMEANGAGPSQSSAVGGAARGAALGAIGGAIGGNAGKGAAIGAAVGGVGTGMRNRRSRVQYDHAKQSADAEFSRAFSACLEGRGYTVK